MKNADWVTLTNKNDMQVSIKYEKITLLTELTPTNDDITLDHCNTLVECSDGIRVPVQEKRADIISLTNTMEMYLEKEQNGKLTKRPQGNQRRTPPKR